MDRLIAHRLPGLLVVGCRPATGTLSGGWEKWYDFGFHDEAYTVLEPAAGGIFPDDFGHLLVGDVWNDAAYTTSDWGVLKLRPDGDVDPNGMQDVCWFSPLGVPPVATDEIFTQTLVAVTLTGAEPNTNLERYWRPPAIDVRCRGNY